MAKTEGKSLSPGLRILCRDAEWLITRVDTYDVFNNHFVVHCVGVDDLVRGHRTAFLTQLDEIEPVDPENTKLVADTSNGYKLSKLLLEAQLRQMPSAGIIPDFDGMGVFNPYKFQEETVRRALMQLRPRLLLADTVGLGKTIQVGMILTELLRRGRANRILVLAKKSMLTQFQSELWNRFSIPLVRMDSLGISRLRLKIPANKNPFEVYHRVIISIDTLKNVARYEHFLKETRWDVVVIDEAHNVAGASVPKSHLSYRLARLLSRRTDSLLLTTATPHNGRPETFGRLISMLDPSAIPDPNLKEYSADDIKDFFLMRFKEDVREEVGDQMATRTVIPISQTTAPADQAEEFIYGMLADLRDRVFQEKKEAKTGETRWLKSPLLMYGLYKLFLSSPEACLKTVRNRLESLRKDEENLEEIALLEKIEQQLRLLDIKKTARYRLLKKQLQEIGWNGKKASPRVLVFTEYRATQDALAKALVDDYKIKYNEKFDDKTKPSLATIHGSNSDIDLMNTVEAFGTGSSSLRMLLATDVASEGVNLHHECHHIVHYDLPWSIITLVQRNGRIDRMGQEESPVLRYLMVETDQGLLEGDTEIFKRLVEKVEEINRMRRSGESVLQLYDPDKEEAYVAERVILERNVDALEQPASEMDTGASELEDVLRFASQQNQEETRNYLEFLTNDNPTEIHSPVEPNPGEGASARIRLKTDMAYLQDGYAYLREQNPDYPKIKSDGKAIELIPPEDLKRRLGAPGQKGDVVFGATAIPEESWPENNVFRLSDNPGQVKQAIKAARAMSGYWTQEQYCHEQHPILQWLTERLTMQLKRDEAPLVLSRSLESKELCFCFIGQYSSKAGTPLVVDAHAITFGRDGKYVHQSLAKALESAEFADLMNTGKMPDLKAAQLLIKSAVSASRRHLDELRKKRDEKIKPLLIKEEKRLLNWSRKRGDLLREKIAELGESHKKVDPYKRELENMEGFLDDRRKNWRNIHLTPADAPSTRLILVIAGA
ncbi:MAG: DEAD/DEAH box helicase [Proteobacteria bacterium]|nr:DEAD/DEAH box helicase [Pseudomonadota bacterium]